MDSSEIEKNKLSAFEARKNNFEARKGSNVNVNKVAAKVVTRDLQSNGCCECYSILPSDFGPGLDTPFVISAPGKYVLNQDIVFLPAVDFTPAIQILSNDVVLDLCNHTLSQGNMTSNSYGIQIGEGYFYNDPDAVLQNITIQNGTIRNFVDVGIFCYNASFDGPTAQVYYSNLNFINLSILQCGNNPSNYFSSGINLDSLAANPTIDGPVAFSNIIIRDCKINDCIGVAAINIYIVNDLIIENTQANNLFCNEAGVFGPFAIQIFGLNIKIYKVQANNVNFTDPISRFQCGGLYCTQSYNINIKESQFNNAFGYASSIVNTNLSLNNNLVAENSQFNNNRGGDMALQVVGVHASGNVTADREGTGYKFINCQFNNSTISNTNVNPNVIVLGGTTITTGKNVIFEKCQSCNIQTDLNIPYVWGFGLFSGPTDQPFQFATSSNNCFIDCVVSDIRGTNSVFGYITGTEIATIDKQIGTSKNQIYNGCIAQNISSKSSTEKVSGIHHGIVVGGFSNDIAAQKLVNLTIEKSTISDVKSSGSPLSAGILVYSTRNPNLIDNTITDCERGILLTGTDDLFVNAFQVAESTENALAGIPINIEGGLYITTNKPGLGPFPLRKTSNSPLLVSQIIAEGEASNPINACSALTNNLSNKIGFLQWSVPSCSGSGTRVNRLFAAGAVAAIIIDTPTSSGNFAGSATSFNASINFTDGNNILNAIAAQDPNDPVILTITIIPSNTQLFTNLVKNNVASFDANDIDNVRDFIFPNEDLNILNWQTGEPIVYNNNGGTDLLGLTGGTTYYVIVYRPGFSERGLIKNNNVSNCSVSGFQDDKTPCTSSVWLSNTAFCNGEKGKHNYEIHWGGRKPVATGNLSCYPKPKTYIENVSITCGPCDCRSKKH